MKTKKQQLNNLNCGCGGDCAIVEPQHTPTPWKVQKRSGYGNGSYGLEITAGGVTVADVVMQLDDKEKANAAFIVRAVNAHQEVIKALKAVQVVFDLHPEIAKDFNHANPLTVETVVKAIAKAEGK